MLYCLWVSPHLRLVTPFSHFSHYADVCTHLLTTLGRTWKVARSACQKFEILVELTKATWVDHLPPEGQNNEATTMDATRSIDLGKQSEVGNIQRNWAVDNSMDGIGLGDIDWSTLDVNYENTTALLEELGDMGDCFSLGWIGDFNEARVS